MTPLLSPKSDIENLQKEYQLYASCNFNPEKFSKLRIQLEELVLEECEL